MAKKTNNKKRKRFSKIDTVKSSSNDIVSMFRDFKQVIVESIQIIRNPDTKYDSKKLTPGVIIALIVFLCLLVFFIYDFAQNGVRV